MPNNTYMLIQHIQPNNNTYQHNQAYHVLSVSAPNRYYYLRLQAPLRMFALQYIMLFTSSLHYFIYNSELLYLHHSHLATLFQARQPPQTCSRTDFTAPSTVFLLTTTSIALRTRLPHPSLCCLYYFLYFLYFL